LLGIVLGGIGGHKFYMGSWGWGIIYLLFCWTWIPTIVGVVEWIRYILMTDDEFAMKAVTFQGNRPFGFFW
jgi:TM2 domain-containing membrane protein YozV